MTEENKTEKSRQEIEIERLKYSYDKTLEIFKMQNDNYFTRVQLLMVAIQGTLFLALSKAVFIETKLLSFYVILAFLSVLGIFTARLWNRIHTRQIQNLEFCRRFLRNLESRFSALGVPLEYLTSESLVFRPREKDLPSEAINLPLLSIQLKKEKSGILYLFFKWSAERYPDKIDKKDIHSEERITRFGMVRYESFLPKTVFVLWILILLIAGISFSFSVITYKCSLLNLILSAITF